MSRIECAVLFYQHVFLWNLSFIPTIHVSHFTIALDSDAGLQTPIEWLKSSVLKTRQISAKELLLYQALINLRLRTHLGVVRRPYLQINKKKIAVIKTFSQCILPWRHNL